MNPKYKVVFAHDHRFIVSEGKFHSRGGLPETVLKRYSEFFGKVSVICRAELAEPKGIPPIDHADISFLPQIDIRKPSNLLSLFSVARSVSRAVSEADAVIARLPSSLGWLAARAARNQGKPYLVEVVGNAQEASALHGSKLGQFIGRMEHFLTKREVRQARHVIYITEKHLQTVYPTCGTQYVCPNVSVVVDSSLQVFEQQVSYKGGPELKIGLVGSLDVNYKGHDVAIDVLDRLIRNHGFSNLSLHFAGGGVQDRWIKLARSRGMESNLTFHGSIPAGTSMMAWIDEMTIMLQPSLTEGQGRSIIEAMSRGKPVVASNVGGIPELLNEEWMTYPKDIAGLADRCAYILRSPSEYKAVAMTNLASAKNFDGGRIEARRRVAFAAVLQNVDYPGKAAKSDRISS